jgi:hypothetical protein
MAAPAAVFVAIVTAVPHVAIVVAIPIAVLALKAVLILPN